MEQPDPKNQRLSPAVLQALVVCVALVLCALVFVFVRLQTRQEALFQTPELTPLQSTGLHKAVVIERMADAGLRVEAIDESKHIYAVDMLEEEEGRTFTLAFALLDGYVQGFSLLSPASILEQRGTTVQDDLPEEAVYAFPKSEWYFADWYAAREETDSPLEEPPAVDMGINSPGEWKAAQATGEQNVTAETAEKRLSAIVSALMNAVEPNAYFPPAALVRWLSLAADTEESGNAKRDTQQGYAFAVMRTAEGRLLLAVNRE